MKFYIPPFLRTFAADKAATGAGLPMKTTFLKYITGVLLVSSFLLGSFGNDVLIHMGAINPVLKDYVLDSESKNADANSEDSQENTEKGSKEGAEYIHFDDQSEVSLLLLTGTILTTYISYSPQSIFFPVPTPPPDLA